MPLYEFQCHACEEGFEELVIGPSEDIRCPSCDSGDVAKKMSTFAFKSGGKFSSSRGSCGSCASGPGGCSGCSCH